MMSQSLKTLTLLGFALIITGQPGLARSQDLVITDGKGEQISIKNGWFGRKQVKVEDRLGNKFENKKGWFGSKDQEVNLLGNQIKRKKGWFGGSSIEGNSILGDKISTKKTLLGRRQTTVDVSGVSSAIEQLFGKSPTTNYFPDAVKPAPLPSNTDPLEQDVLQDPQ